MRIVIFILLGLAQQQQKSIPRLCFDEYFVLHFLSNSEFVHVEKEAEGYKTTKYGIKDLVSLNSD